MVNELIINANVARTKPGAGARDNQVNLTPYAQITQQSNKSQNFFNSIVNDPVDFSDYENVDLGAGQKTATLNGDKHCVDATKGEKLIYVNSENNLIKTDGNDIIAVSRDIDVNKVYIQGEFNADNICYADELTDEQKKSFEGTNKAFYS